MKWIERYVETRRILFINEERSENGCRIDLDIDLGVPSPYLIVIDRNELVTVVPYNVMFNALDAMIPTLDSVAGRIQEQISQRVANWGRP
jgi:hypothetical protein